MASGNMHHVVGADDSCISWGVAQNGELGYGPNGQKYVYIKIEYVDCTKTFTHYTGLIGHCCSIYLCCRSSANPKKVDILEGMHVTR